MNNYDPIVGYLELGMADDALSELDSMSVVKKKTERHMELLLAAQMMLKEWHNAAQTAEKLCTLNSKKCVYFIHAAYCLHAVGDTARAMERLLSGPKNLMQKPLYHYNLACYYAVLGKTKHAESSLKKAFEMDGDLRDIALKDEDLEGIKVTSGNS